MQQAYQQHQEAGGAAELDFEFEEDEELDYDQLGYEVRQKLPGCSVNNSFQLCKLAAGQSMR